MSQNSENAFFKGIISINCVHLSLFLMLVLKLVTVVTKNLLRDRHITDVIKILAGVSSPCLLDCLCLHEIRNFQ